MPETTARVVPMCELCRRVYDHGHDSGHASVWMQLQSYVTQHHLHSKQIVFSHSYCDDCRNGFALAATYGGS